MCRSGGVFDTRERGFSAAARDPRGIHQYSAEDRQRWILWPVDPIHGRVAYPEYFLKHWGGRKPFWNQLPERHRRHENILQLQRQRRPYLDGQILFQRPVLGGPDRDFIFP